MGTIDFVLTVSYFLALLHRVDSFPTVVWTGLFPIAECLVIITMFLLLLLLLLYFFFLEIPVLNANSVDTDQTPSSAGSDVSALFAHSGVSRLKWFITPFVLGSMSVGLNILIRHSFMDL